jgi:hypothetical protein
MNFITNQIGDHYKQETSNMKEQADQEFSKRKDEFMKNYSPGQLEEDRHKGITREINMEGLTDKLKSLVQKKVDDFTQEQSGNN